VLATGFVYAFKGVSAKIVALTLQKVGGRGFYAIGVANKEG